jgi:hypothetical protein
MKVTTEQLELIFKEIISKIENHFGKEIDLDDKKDFYWNVLEKEIFEVDNELLNEEVSIGQISDDWSELIRFLDEREELISYDLIRLSNVLMALREKSKGTW